MCCQNELQLCAAAKIETVPAFHVRGFPSPSSPPSPYTPHPTHSTHPTQCLPAYPLVPTQVFPWRGQPHPEDPSEIVKIPVVFDLKANGLR